jgi:hypothetical protein
MIAAKERKEHKNKGGFFDRIYGILKTEQARREEFHTEEEKAFFHREIR